MSAEPIQIVFLGLDSFPGYLAEAQKSRLIARSLVESGCTVTVINRWWNVDMKPTGQTLYAEGEFQGLKYVFACGTPERPSSWILRKLLRIKGLIVELLVLQRMSKVRHIQGALISPRNFLDILYYRLLSSLFSFPLVLTLVESFSAITQRASFLVRINAFLLDRFAPRLAHGVLPISEHLSSTCKLIVPRKPLLKVPVLVDFGRFENVHRQSVEKYLLYCGSLGYLEVIRFILKAYQISAATRDVYLYLVVSGSAIQFDGLSKDIADIKKGELVKVYTRQSDEQLTQLYINAYALLIPLRPTVRDTARFPHKIGEYCASGRPIATIASGEIPLYFEHGKNAMIAETYDTVSYARILDQLLADPAMAEKIGSEGKSVAEKEFNYRLYGPRIKHFITSLASEA
jgi:glycosyltransferase involved in cell wall biosynthesis